MGHDVIYEGCITSTPPLPQGSILTIPEAVKVKFAGVDLDIITCLSQTTDGNVKASDSEKIYLDDMQKALEKLSNAFPKHTFHGNLLWRDRDENEKGFMHII